MIPDPQNEALLPDEATVERCCDSAVAGNTESLERLLAHYHIRFLSHTRRKVGADWAGRLEAEDILQEAYADAFATIRSFTYRGDESFYNWIVRIIDHRFVDQLRHAKRKKRGADRQVRLQGPHSTWNSLLDQCFADPNSPSLAMRREDAAAALIRCVACLPPDYREAVQRVFLNEEPLATVAADLGKSEDALRRLAGRALERLRDCLGRASRYIGPR